MQLRWRGQCPEQAFGLPDAVFAGIGSIVWKLMLDSGRLPVIALIELMEHH